MGSFRDAAKSLRITAQAVDASATQLVKKVTEVVGYSVVYATPVDTSRARMNWQGSVGSPKEGVLLEAPLQPSDPSQGPQVALESIRGAAADYSGQNGGVWIVNNLSYIMVLNNGSSSQAPADFVALSVQSGVETIRKHKLIK